MLNVTLMINGAKVIVMGDLMTIKRTAADRLACTQERLVFKIRNHSDESFDEIVLSDEAWEQFTKKNRTLYAFERRPVAKRKATSPDLDIDRRNRSHSSAKTPPRPESIQRRQSQESSKKVNWKSESSNSRTKHSNSRARRTKKVVGGGLKWEVKDDAILWSRVLEHLKKLPEPDPIYTSEQKRLLFSTIQDRYFNANRARGARTRSALESRMRERVREAYLRREGNTLPSQLKALFPLVKRGRNTTEITEITSDSEVGNDDVVDVDDDDDDDEEDEEEDDDEDESSSSSESTPPPKVVAAGPREPARIREFDPFAKVAQRVRSSNEAGPSSSNAKATFSHALSQSDAASERVHSSSSARPPEIVHAPSVTPTASTPNNIQQIGQGSIRISIQNSLRDKNSKNGRNEAESIVQGTSSEVTGSADLTTAKHSIQNLAETASVLAPPLQPPVVQPEPVPSRPVVEGNTGRRSFSNNAAEAIVIKDEDSEDEVIGVKAAAVTNEDSSMTTLQRNAASMKIKTEYQAARDVVRSHLKNVFPLEKLDLLPSEVWAVNLSNWIKWHGLVDVHDKDRRRELLYAIFDEFFYYSYSNINEAYSIRRASFGMIFLFLDLYHCLLEVEEAQEALIELFYQRIFANPSSASDHNDWPSHDICAAGAFILPIRPTWLLDQIFQKAKNFLILEVPPPLAQVANTTHRLHLLMKKVNESRIWLDRNKNFWPLYGSVHEPFFNDSVISNLKAQYRQTRQRLSESTSRDMEKTLLELDNHNRIARVEDTKRTENEETFISERIILLSSPHRLTASEVESFSTTYSLSNLVQLANGPSMKKLVSTSEKYYLWLLQFRDKETKGKAILNLRDFAPTEELQYFSEWKQTHSWNRSTTAKQEQQRWNRSCCDMNLHRVMHRKMFLRIKSEQQQMNREPVIDLSRR